MIEAGYPTGASADAMYYDTNQSKTGWYAIAAFLALIVLVVGGVLLFQALSGDNTNDEPTQFILADYTNPPQLLADVTADLDSLGIRYETIAEESPLVPVGFVHRTNPVAGTLILADQTVQVYFNPDPQLVPVPGVVGLTLEDARLRLEGEGFTIGEITIEKTDEVAENTVISTDPAADTPALQGSTVDIVVAGPPDSVQVPGQVVGMTEIDARALLEAPPYDFTVTTAVQSSSTIPEGTVIEINPGPGALVEIGSAVTIVVSTGPQPITVPSVVGRTEGRRAQHPHERRPRRARHVRGGPRGQPRRRARRRPEPPGRVARRPGQRDHDHRRPVGAGGHHPAADGPADDRSTHDGPAADRTAADRGAHHRGTHDAPSDHDRLTY